MRFSLLTIITAAALAACARSETRPIPGGGSGGGSADSGTVQPDASSPDAAETLDVGVVADAGLAACSDEIEPSCGARPDCRPQYCSTCTGGDEFTGCFRRDVMPPPCPLIDCSDECERVNDPMQCNSIVGCGWQACQGCSPGEIIFEQCVDLDVGIACPPIACPDCEQYDEATCLTEPDCHAVYSDHRVATCDCDAPGCCITFDRCAMGEYANCGPEMISCRRVQPSCDGPFVVSYDGMGCYEGCARSDECAP